MFGYVKPVTCRLTEDEKELYKSIYCGMCHSLGEICGNSARFTLSYDFVFLALLRMAALSETPQSTLRRCPSHPIGGCLAVTDSKTIQYCAALSALLQYESVQDKLADEKRFRRLAARIALCFEGNYLRKAMQKYDLPILPVRKRLKELGDLEKRGCNSPDAVAHVFGILLSEVSVYGIEDELIRFAISEITYHLGKWIYLIDAADDFQKDRKHNRYNPFLPEIPDPQVLGNALEWELSHCDGLLSKLPCKDERMKKLLENILYHGTAAVSKAVLYPEAKTKGNAKA